MYRWEYMYEYNESVLKETIIVIFYKLLDKMM